MQGLRDLQKGWLEYDVSVLHVRRRRCLQIRWIVVESCKSSTQVQKVQGLRSYVSELMPATRPPLVLKSSSIDSYVNTSTLHGFLSRLTLSLLACVTLQVSAR